MSVLHPALSGCVFLVVLLGSSRQIRAQDAPVEDAPAGEAVALDAKLVVEVTAAETGRVLHGAACGLQRAGTRRSYAQFQAPAYRGRPPIQEGDLLHVYVRGRDLVRIRLAKGQQGAKVALKLATRQSAVKLEGADTEDVRFRLTWWIEAAGEWEGKAPISARFEETVRGPRIRRVLPAEANLYVTVESPGVIVWPRMARLRPVAAAEGANPAKADRAEVRATLHVDQPWRPVIRFRAGKTAPQCDFFADYGVEPPGPPLRVDAWRWAVHKPWWGRGPGKLRSGAKLSILPAVPFHVVASYGHETVVLYCKPGQTEIRLDEAVKFRQVSAPPEVDGRSVRAGSFLLPGHLDIATVAGFLDVQLSYYRLVVRVPTSGPKGEERTADWPGERPVELPAADWLTVWHPKDGLAHLRWKAGERPVGKRYRASMTVRSPRGWRMSGEIFAFPVWHGTGRVSTTPPLTNLGRTVQSAESLRIGGLPAGWYAFVFRLKLVDAKSGRKRRFDRRIEREIGQQAEERAGNAEAHASSFTIPVPR